MAVDFKTFSSIVGHVTDVRKPVLLRGRHGIGKSTVVYQYADSVGLPVVERRASQMTEGDLVGLPVIADNSTTFNPPDWFKKACDEPVILFLDEVDRATLEVRQGIFELTDSRKLNGHTLHQDTLVSPLSTVVSMAHSIRLVKWIQPSLIAGLYLTSSQVLKTG